MKTIRIKVNGEEKEALVSSTIIKLKRKRTIKGKEYTWDDYKLIVYIPKSWRKYKKFMVVPAE